MISTLFKGRFYFSPVFACMIVACLSLTSQSSYAVDKIDATKQDISGIQQKINQIKQKLSQSQKEKNDVTDALKQSETAISLANKALHNIQLEQKQNESKLNQLKKQSLLISNQLAAQQKQLSQLSKLYQANITKQKSQQNLTRPKISSLHCQSTHQTHP